MTEKELTDTVEIMERALKLDKNLNLYRLSLGASLKWGDGCTYNWYITAYYKDGGFADFPVSTNHLIEDIVDGVYNSHKTYLIKKDELIDGLYDILNNKELNLSDDNKYNLKLAITLASEYGSQPLHQKWED